MWLAYYRYSSSSQNEASIEQQRETVQRWATSQGLIVVSEYEDAAKIGTNADRPGYQLMLRDLKKIKPAYVAVWKNDRLVRDRAELLLVKQAIRAAGARVHYIEGISPTDAPDSVLMEGVADAFAEYYSLQLSANIKRGQRYNAERALSNGHKIFGFVRDEDKRYAPDPETAPNRHADLLGLRPRHLEAEDCRQAQRPGRAHDAGPPLHAEELEQDPEKQGLRGRVRLRRVRHRVRDAPPRRGRRVRRGPAQVRDQQAPWGKNES